MASITGFTPGRVDYNISSRQTLSFAITGGNRHAVPYTSARAAPLPVPYYASTKSTVAGHWAELEHTFTFTPHLVNQFKYGFMNFGGPPVQNITQGNPAVCSFCVGDYRASCGPGLGKLSQHFVRRSQSSSRLSTGTAIGWVGNTPTTTNVSETYTALDNMNLLKGKHSMNFGGQFQWLENNASTADGPSTPTPLNWSVKETSSHYGNDLHREHRLFLCQLTCWALSAVRARPCSRSAWWADGSVLPHFTSRTITRSRPKLTLNLGLRWDYLPTYREAQDRWSFLNPNLTNPITGSPGLLQFAGHRGAGVSCECSTPVNTYWKNYGPRLGFAYSADDKTVFRGGWGILYSHAGGTGGAGGAGTGTGQAGFNSTTSFADGAAGASAGPAFYLNNNPAFSAPNANFGGPGYVLPAIAPITATSQLQGTGFFVCSGQAIAQCNGATGTSGGKWNGNRLCGSVSFGSRAGVFLL